MDLFERAEAGSEVSKEQYEERAGALRVELLNAQFDLQNADCAVLILVIGDDAEGCEEVIDLLNEWLDARLVDTEVFLEPTQDERERPPFWRYWRALPRDGRIGIFLGAWAYDAIAGRWKGELDDEGFERYLAHARRQERAFADDGTLVLKFWLHIPKKEIGKRLEKAKKRKVGWRAAEQERRMHADYEELTALGERLVRATDRPHAPWTIVEGTDERHRDLCVAETLLGALAQRLGRPPSSAPAPAVVAKGSEGERRGALAGVDLAATIERDEYKERLDELQRHLAELGVAGREQGVSSVLVFEGWDAAGKGGAIRRITRALPARDYRVVPIAAPTDEERAHHYLWRFWRWLPRAGRMLIFDRSWYGRVLVERVEGLATEAQWRRAYDEIADFEDQLVEHGMPVCKFWLHISPEEQLRRFREREGTPYKKYKITRDDYRNRGQWDAYSRAVDEMVARTSSEAAPWVLVPAEDKRVARVRVLEEVCRALERALE